MHSLGVNLSVTLPEVLEVITTCYASQPVAATFSFGAYRFSFSSYMRHRGHVVAVGIVDRA